VYPFQIKKFFKDLDQPLSPAEYIVMRGHRASSEGAASANGDSDESLLHNQLSPPSRLSRPSSATWNMVSILVNYKESIP
jgi:hypothetical protein